MLPFERLRALAQYRGDDEGLVLEAAACLGDFAVDPTHLVTVCRRLVTHHPAHGPLWWLCARVLAAPDPDIAARRAAELLAADRTASHLAGHLPFPHDDVIVTVGWSPTLADALLDRPDLDVVTVLDPLGELGDRSWRTPRPWDHSVRIVEGPDLAELRPSHVLVPVAAMSPTVALVPAGVSALLGAAPGTRRWLVGGVGRLLPERLFAALHANLETDPERRFEAEQWETTTVADATLVVTPDGLDTPTQVASRVDCPVAPELLRL